VLRAIEEVLAQPGFRTRDLGGTANTIACADAIVDAIGA
jgi:tartrate dehydrogenase/decarboxylase/D-malate dehydrogenase